MGNVTLLLEKLYWEIALFVKDELVDDGPIWATEKKKKKAILQTKTFLMFAPSKNEFSIQKNYYTYPQKS